jgi:uncharacterized protein (TIGR02231 family)
MKNLRYYLSLTLLLVPAATFAAELQRLPASSRITAVTVYPDRALTSRAAALKLKPGSYLVTFDSLPPLMQDDSVRVSGKGSAGVTIVGLEVKRAFLEQSGEKRVKELDEEIRGLEQRVGGLDARKAGLAAQKAFFESIRVAWGDRLSKELAIGRPTAAELQEAATLVGTGVTKVEEQGLDLETEQKTIKDRIDALRRQRNGAVGSQRKESKTVEVTLEVAREGDLTLDLAAVVPQAGWVPAYDVRLAADARSAELTFRALVRQQTGEDWNNVDLTLSTARPAAGGAPPELYPWRIAFFRPPPPMPAPVMLGAAGSAPQREKMARMAVRGPTEDVLSEEAPAAFETAQISEEQSSAAFHIPRPIDIPADGTQHGSVVAVEQLPVTMEFLAVPKLSPYVFLKSEIVNRAAYPLLPGKVNTFAGNTYTGSAQLRKIAAGEKFDLFFGADDQVAVKREELKQHKEAGLFGKNRASYRYRIELNNFRKEPVLVTLRDQLPLAGDEEIKVSLDDPSVQPDELGSDGRITWKTALKAGEKKELTFGILVEYPKDRELTGL